MTSCTEYTVDTIQIIHDIIESQRHEVVLLSKWQPSFRRVWFTLVSLSKKKKKVLNVSKAAEFIENRKFKNAERRVLGKIIRKVKKKKGMLLLKGSEKMCDK